MPLTFIPRLTALRVRAGVVYNPIYNPPTHDFIPNGDFSCDPSGNLYVTEGIGPQTPSNGGFTYEAIPGLTTAVIVGNAPCIITQVGGFNDDPTNAVYVQLFDKDSTPLAGGEVPFMTFRVTANASFAWKPSRGGRAVTDGLVFGVSSTRDTYSASAITIFLFAEGYVELP